MRTQRRLTAVGLALAALGTRSRLARVAAGATFVVDSAVTRFGVFEAGRQSARDPKYVVVPQRERLARRPGEQHKVVT